MRDRRPVKHKRLGRPRVFRKRTGLRVFLEAAELAAIERQAQAAGLSVSAFGRRVLVRALGLGRRAPSARKDT